MTLRQAGTQGFARFASPKRRTQARIWSSGPFSTSLCSSRERTRAQAKGIEAVVFDRNGFLYHGRVAALADAAREAGLKLTHQRLEIFRELAATEEHPDAETIFRAVQQQGGYVDLR